MRLSTGCAARVSSAGGAGRGNNSVSRNAAIRAARLIISGCIVDAIGYANQDLSAPMCLGSQRPVFSWVTIRRHEREAGVKTTRQGDCRGIAALRPASTSVIEIDLHEYIHIENNVLFPEVDAAGKQDRCLTETGEETESV
jgi:hypothetical protein